MEIPPIFKITPEILDLIAQIIVNKISLRYDLKKLHKKGLIVKTGETRVSYYTIEAPRAESPRILKD